MRGLGINARWRSLRLEIDFLNVVLVVELDGERQQRQQRQQTETNDDPIQRDVIIRQFTSVVYFGGSLTRPYWSS